MNLGVPFPGVKESWERLSDIEWYREEGDELVPYSYEDMKMCCKCCILVADANGNTSLTCMCDSRWYETPADRKRWTVTLEPGDWAKDLVNDTDKVLVCEVEDHVTVKEVR